MDVGRSRSLRALYQRPLLAVRIAGQEAVDELPLCWRADWLIAVEQFHDCRARAEDRLRAAKATGLSNLPLHGFAHNKIWVAIVALALELTAWTQMLALTGHPARRWEPKRLRLRLFTIAARLAHHARQVHLRLATHAPWADLVRTAHQRLHHLPQLA